jgi:single-strand DNA-binding protein
MNKAILIGNLGADPELRQVGDSAVCNMRIATTDSFKDRDGKRQERTDWHNVSAWGPQGESCAKYLRKGSKVGVEGQIQTRSYDKDGQKHYATEIRASHVEFLDGKKDGSGGDDGRGQGDSFRDDDRRERPADNRGGGGGYRQNDRAPAQNGGRDNRGNGRTAPAPRGNGRDFT